MDGADRLPKGQVFKIKDDGTLEQAKDYRCLQLNDRPGCSYCISKNLIPILKKYCFEGSPHDALAWSTAFSYNGLYILHKQLFSYRRHDSNATGSRNQLNQDPRINFIRLMLNYLNIEKNISIEMKNIEMQKYIDKCIVSYDNRIEFLEKNSIFKWMLNFKNIKYYPTTKTYFGDGVCILKTKMK